MSVYVAFDIYPAATPNGTLLVRLTVEEGVELTAKKVLHGTGEGTIRIHSAHPDATTTNFAKRNYVKVVVVNGATETEWFGFFLEQGDFGAISRREQGGRMLTFTGLGSLFYLDRAVLLAEIYAPGQPRRGNLTIDGSWGWNDIPYGAIMTRAMEEGYYAPGSPLSEATWDFTRTEDSASVAWPNIDNEFIVPWGTSVYELIASFIRLGLVVTVDADLTFHAWQTYGTNRTSATFATGKIRYEHGVNITNEVVRQIRASLERSHIFVTGDEFTSTVVSGGSSAVTYYDHLQKNETNNTATLTAAGERDLAQREIQADAAFPVRVIIDDDELNGLYVPGEHYDVGDIVTIDTVPPDGASGTHDYVNFAIEVAAIKLEHDDAGNWFAVNELGAQYLTAQLSAFEVSSSTLVTQIELCRTNIVGAVDIVGTGGFQSNVGGTVGPAPSDADALIVGTVAATTSGGSTPPTVDGVPMTLVPGSVATQSTVIPGRADFVEVRWYYAAISGGSSPNVGFTEGTNGNYWGFGWASGFLSAVAAGTAFGTSSTPSGAHSGSGGQALTLLGSFAIGGTDGADPAIAAPGVSMFSHTGPTGNGMLYFAAAYGDPTPSYTTPGSQPWALSMIWLNGSAGVGDEGPLDTVLQGEETHGTSIRATRCDHQHAHGLLSDLGTHYHEADQIDGATGAPTTADYLVGTAQAGLSAEIVVGTTPGGELGNTWASPTVDSTHAGSNHLQPVRKNSAGTVFERRRLNLIEGSNVTLTVADDAGNDEVDITIASSVSGGSLTVEEEDGTPTGTPDTLKFSNGTVTDNGDGSFSIDTSGVGSGMVYPYTDMDEPPASPHASNMEGTSMTGWSWLTSSGSVTEQGVLDQMFSDDSGPAAPSWNVNSDLSGRLVFQPVASGKLATYRAFAPASGTEWMVAIKAWLLPGSNELSNDDRFMFGVTDDATPSIASNEVADSMAVELRTAGASFTHANIRPGSRGNESGSLPGVIYGAITGRTDNSIVTFASTDGIHWRRKGRITSGTAPAGAGTVTNVFAYCQALAGSGQAPVIIVEWIRFKEGSNNLFELGGGR